MCDAGTSQRSERAPCVRTHRQAIESGLARTPQGASARVSLSPGVPHSEGGELIYPGVCRDKPFDFEDEETALAVNWRFRVPAGETISFEDGNYGQKEFLVGRDFGDFLIWRKDGIPSYELAVVADDIAMRVLNLVSLQVFLDLTFPLFLNFRYQYPQKID